MIWSIMEEQGDLEEQYGKLQFLSVVLWEKKAKIKRGKVVDQTMKINNR